MKKGLSEIVYILDMTGSMKPLEVEAVVGFNNFIEDQKKYPGEALVTLVVFNSQETRRVFDRVNLKNISPMEQKDYKPDSLTPLLDTIGNTINSVGETLKNTPESERPENVIFVIMTDGEENFSRKFKRKQIFDMVTHQKEVYKWDFIFMGANQDSYLEAGRLGIDTKDTQNYDFSTNGIRIAYATASCGVGARRESSELPDPIVDILGEKGKGNARKTNSVP